MESIEIRKLSLPTMAMQKLQIAHQACQLFKSKIAILASPRANCVASADFDIVVIPCNPSTQTFMELIDQIRWYSGMGVIVYLINYEEFFEITALSEDAEDVLNASMSTHVIAARLMSAVRRRSGRSVLPKESNAKSTDHELLEPCGASQLCIKLAIDSKQILLKGAEAKIIDLMLKSENRIASHAQICNALISHHTQRGSPSVSSHIKRIRGKLRTLFPHETFIHSVYGAGYRLATKRDISLRPVIVTSVKIL
jgi:DNA-binding response OmpR family regulator